MLKISSFYHTLQFLYNLPPKIKEKAKLKSQLPCVEYVLTSLECIVSVSCLWRYLLHYQVVGMNMLLKYEMICYGHATKLIVVVFTVTFRSIYGKIFFRVG